MSDPAPPLPPVDNPAEPRISDRAALEAALVGAAGLLLGRMFLGRGFGLLAGSAAIAARLLTDAASKKPAADPAADPAEAPAGPGPEPEPVIPEAAAPEILTDEPAAVIPEAVPFIALAEPALSSGPAPLPVDPIAEENPFANLFTESPPDSASALPSLIGSFQPEPPSTDFLTPEPVEADPDVTLPAFPDLEDALPADKPAASGTANQTSPDTTPLPGLSHFPDPTTPLPHPDEIWKMAAEESAHIADPSPGPGLVTGVFPLPFTFPEAEEADPPTPSPEAPILAEPLPDPEPTEPPALELTLTPPSEEPIPAFPPSASFLAQSGFLPAVDPEPVIEVLDSPAPESPAAAEVPAPTVPEVILEAPLPPEADALPVLSLKVKAPSPTSLPSAFAPLAAPAGLEPPADANIAPPPQPAADLIPENQVAPALAAEPPPTAASDSSLAPPAPRRATKAWVILLLLAAVLTWLYRHEIKKIAQSKAAPPVQSQSKNHPKAPAPAAVPPPMVPTPPKPPVPVPPPTPDPKPPVPTPPETKPATVPTPPPSASLIAPSVYGEPLPGVPQDFPPGSLEARSRQVLERLLDASSANEAKPLIHEPAASLKQASAWYPNGKLSPAPWKRIIFDSSDKLPRSAYKASFFRVVTEAIPMGFPVAVEDTKDGPLIDLNAFIQCRDRLLDTFISSPGKPAHPFLVVLRRGHYFGDDLSATELEKLICFEIASPNPGSVKHRVFIQKGSDLGQLALKKFVWDKSYTPVVQLTHAGKHVEITAVLRDVWRSIPP